MIQKVDSQGVSPNNPNVIVNGKVHPEKINEMIEKINILEQSDGNGSGEEYIISKTAAQWVSDNTVLESYQVGVESDTGLFKIGAGAWNSKKYVYTGSSRDIRLHYGAKGDGVSDDTAAFTAAAADGVSLFLSPGNYRVTSQINLPANFCITGCGELSKVIVVGNITAFQLDADGITMSNFAIEGAGTRNGTGIFIGDVRYGARLSGMILRNLDKGVGCNREDIFFGSDAIEAIPLIGNIARNCTYGYWSTTRGEGLHFSNNHAVECGTGYYIRGGNCFINAGTAKDCGTGIYLATGTNDSHGSCTNFYIAHNTNYSIRTEAIQYGWTFTNCKIYNDAIYLDGAKGVNFIDCDIDINNYYFRGCRGILFKEIRRGVVNAANTINDNYQGQISTVEWRGVRYLTGEEFYIYGRATREYILWRDTTDATLTELTKDGAAPSNYFNRIDVPGGTSMSCEAHFIARDSSGGTKHFFRRFMIKNVSGTVSLEGAVEPIGIDDGAVALATADVSITANNTAGCINASVTGVAATNIKWSCRIKTIEVQ